MYIIRLAALAIAFAFLGGCAAGEVAIKKHALSLETKMTSTVFVQPSSQKTIYVQARNTSEKPAFDLAAPLITALRGKGYDVVTSPEAAQYLLQVNVLSVAQVSQSAAQAATHGAFGTPIDGAIAGMATVAALNGSISGRGLGAVGVAAGAADFLAGALVKNVWLSAVADVQVSERAKAPMQITGEMTVEQGSLSSQKTTFTDQTEFRQYRTRVVANANKVNLKWEEAEPQMVSNLAQSISGIF